MYRWLTSSLGTLSFNKKQENVGAIWKHPVCKKNMVYFVLKATWKISGLPKKSQFLVLSWNQNVGIGDPPFCMVNILIAPIFSMVLTCTKLLDKLTWNSGIGKTPSLSHILLGFFYSTTSLKATLNSTSDWVLAKLQQKKTKHQAENSLQDPAMLIIKSP